MFIGGNMNEEIDQIIKNNTINYIGNLVLNNHEISILDRYNINYKNCSDMKELMFILEEYLNDIDSDEIEDILMSISERDYYKNSNK